MDGLTTLGIAVACFVGTHFLLSHPLRRPLVGAISERGFLALYSIVAFATLGASVWAYRAAPVTAPLWPVGNGLWLVATIVMLIASVLLLGSFIKNPALPGAQKTAATAANRGVFAVTRHPMMWSFALWAIAHILVYPVAKNLLMSIGILVLALVGSVMQDRKKALHDPQGWEAWKHRTSFWPFLAIVQGRAKWGGFGMHALAGGVVVWLLASWLHVPLTGWAAGVWRWVL